MKRKRYHRSGSEVRAEEQREADDEREDRLERLLEAAGAAAMPEASDGDQAPNESEHSEKFVIESVATETVLVENTEMAIDDVEEELTLPNLRRCGLCGGTTDGEPAADNASEVPVGEANGSLKPQEETCPADVTIDTKKSDGFGTEKGWLGRLLGPLGEQFGVGGVWIHENCAIWSPEVYFSGIGRLKNVKAALRRGRLLRCSLCNQPGATIGCRVDRCPQNYHLPCARDEGSMFNHRKYLMACCDHSYLFKRRRKKRYWFSKSLTAQQGGTYSEHPDPPRISKAQRRAAAAAARFKDIEAEEKYLDKSGEDEEFVRRERKRLQRDLAQIAPIKLGGGSLSNNQGVAPEGWESVAGLQDVVQCLKEMVTLPLLYPEAFTRLGISAPRGVLLHGHPGTGKTLVVRALAGACSRGGQQVAYFARKGADILGKYVGDSERQLRLLFQVAEQCQPAIIFFDEIDGLAPSRCGDRDQTQSSVVSTLLALMDGLSSRGSVVVIGATNRPDSLDPALRRPGRFDREIYFPLPSTEDRASILRLHTRKWSPAPSLEILAAVAKATPGFAGADLQALCVEAAMTALRRVVPLKYILDSAAVKGPLETNLPSLPSIQVKAQDWAKAIARAPLPCSRRLASTSLTQTPTAPLPRHLAPVLLPILIEVLVKLGLDARVSLPPLLEKSFSLVKAALIAASTINNIDGHSPDRTVNFPECWLAMVIESFKETPSTLAIAMEDAFLDTGIMVDTYGAPRLSQAVSSVDFASVGTGSDGRPAASKNLEEPSGNGGRVPTCVRQILIDDSLDETEVGIKQKWLGCKFRILLVGDAQQGQKFVAGAIMNGFEGLARMRNLSLPAMLMEGDGDVEQGLIYILGEARRSDPCLLYMPKIEDWVVSKGHDGEHDEGGIVKHPEGFGISNAEADDHLCVGRSETSIDSKDEAPLDVSVAWKLMKQQLQSMPPDTQLMILATCESGVEALPLEVVNYFSPQVETSSRKSSLYPVQVAPCITVEFTNGHDPQCLLERASQDIAKALAAGFASRIARLREAYIAGCSAEKPKLNTAAGVRLSTSVQQIIADKVSQLRTRVREDLGKDLRNIGEDWARNLGEAPLSNGLAKVFGMDVGRGLGLDLGLDFKHLESGLVEEVNKECGVNLEARARGDAEMRDVGASCMIRGQSIEQNDVDVLLKKPQNSDQRKDTGFVVSGNRSLDFNVIDGSANDSMRKKFPLQDECVSASQMEFTPSHQLSMDVEQLEGQTTSEPLVTARNKGSRQADAEEFPPAWTTQRKALQSAIAFCGYRLLRDPQFAGLRNATTMLKSVPVYDIHDSIDDGTFNWETLEIRRKAEVHEPEYVRGLAAVGYKACRGVYKTGREVEFELRRIIETLYERVQQKLDSGKDSLQYFRLTTQAATLVDLMASWVLEVRKLEVAANMHNLPISKSILEDEYIVEDQQDHQDLDPKQVDETIHVEAANGEHHSPEVLLAEAEKGGSGQVENGFVPQQVSKRNSALSGKEDSQKFGANGLREAVLKVIFADEMPTTANIRESQLEANGIARGAPLGICPGENSLMDAAPVSAMSNYKLPVSPDRNGGRAQSRSFADATVENALPGRKSKLLSPFQGSITPETSLREDPPVLAVEGGVSGVKCLRQPVHFKPDCFRQLECVVREFLDLSCQKVISNPSVEVLHDLVTGCASSALAASQNVLNKSEKTNITRQVILQWAGMTCHCGVGRLVESVVGASGMDESPRQLSVNGSSTLSTKQATPTDQGFSRKSKKRKKSRLSLSDFQEPPAEKLSIGSSESSLPAGLVSPMKQTNCTKNYTCLRPVIRAVKNMFDDLSSSKESKSVAYK